MIHSENKVKVVGDEHNNNFSKLKGYAEFHSHSGNDIMSLADGKAFAGSGIDSYIILQALLS